MSSLFSRSPASESIRPPTPKAPAIQQSHSTPLVVRPYRDSDHSLVASWWAEVGEPAPVRSMLPIDSTFIVEAGGRAVGCFTLYLLNARAMAWIDNVVAEPQLTFLERRRAVQTGLTYAERFASALGYERLFTMAPDEKRAKRYTELGFIPTLTQVTTLVKPLSSSAAQPFSNVSKVAGQPSRTRD